MSVKLSFWGENGRINVDRQELQIYIRTLPDSLEGFETGWNTRYTTELTAPVWFYVRGEEYSAQIDHFVQCIKTKATPLSNFRSATDTSLVASLMRTDAEKPRTSIESPGEQGSPAAPRPEKSSTRSLLGRLFNTGRT
jgi:predicted dehydrogenase